MQEPHGKSAAFWKQPWKTWRASSSDKRRKGNSEWGPSLELWLWTLDWWKFLAVWASSRPGPPEESHCTNRAELHGQASSPWHSQHLQDPPWCRLGESWKAHMDEGKEVCFCGLRKDFQSQERLGRWAIWCALRVVKFIYKLLLQHYRPKRLSETWMITAMYFQDVQDNNIG